MLKIKLARFGKRNQPHYRIVVNEARSKRDGQYKAEIGHYAPTDTPKLLKVDFAAYKYWISKGAIPTSTVASLVKRSQTETPFPEKKPRPSKKSIAKKLAAAEEAKAPKEKVVEPVAEEATPDKAETETPTTEEKESPEEIVEKKEEKNEKPA